MNNPINIILDTDIGMDCDDAVALGVLIKAQNDGRCAIRAITAATAREGAISCVRSILGYYGAPEPVLGKLESTFLKCDYVNYYAKAASDKFGFPDDADDAVKVLRRSLATSPAKITLITIGPLTDIADLLRSGADEISPLSGAELMREKVDKVYAMAGSFAGNYADGNAFREWNVLQDIEAARVFCERCPARGRKQDLRRSARRGKPDYVLYAHVLRGVGEKARRRLPPRKLGSRHVHDRA